MQHVALNWSSGKDAALAFYYLQKNANYQVTSLLTTISAAYGRVSMHGIREEVLEQQAQQMGIPLKKIYLQENADMQAYNQVMYNAVSEIKQNGVHTLAFGDIFLEDLRKYREAQLATVNVKAIFPLWKKNTASLVKEIEDVGIKAMIVCVNNLYLGKDFLGRYINRQFLRDLPTGIDPCGENGEFHTLVIDAPHFSKALKVQPGEIVHKKHTTNNDDQEKRESDFYFLDVVSNE